MPGTARPTGPIAPMVEAFVDGVTTELGTLARADGTPVRADVVAEALNLTAALVDADGLQTFDELQGFLDAFAPLVPALAGKRPTELRGSPLLRGRADQLRSVSPLLGALLEADARDGSRRSHTYYRASLELLHAVASLDLVPTERELALIDGYRRLQLQAMEAAGVTRPGAARSPAAPQAATPDTRSLDELLHELDMLVGLDAVKAEVRRLTDLLRVAELRKARGMPVVDTSLHLVFAGNPGTGKTTVARLLAGIYRSLGAVSKGQLVETDRSGLVAGYVGQTAVRTREVAESAIGGVLLIDEAHALSRGEDNDFGREAIDTLVKVMEDHRDDLAVIAAGYTDEMQAFLDANPGLRSRFPKAIEFADYSDDELVTIFCRLGDESRYHPDDATVAKLRAVLAGTPRGHGFGNARFVRNLFEAAVGNQATRVVALPEPDDEQLTTLVAADLPG